MSGRGNSGFLDVDKRFGTSSGDTKGIVSREQHFLERTQSRFSPISAGGIPGGTPTVWLDADSSYITTQGSPQRVDVWVDRSGNNIDANGPGSTNDPLYNTTDSEFNNLGSVDFGADDWLETSDNALLDCTNGFTIYVVTNLNSYPSTFSFLCGFINNTSWSQGWGMFYYSGNWRFFVNNWNSTSTRVDMGAFTDFTNTHIFKLYYDRTNIVGEIIGPSGVAEVTKAYATAVSNPASEGIRLCDGNSATYEINAKIGEVIFYNSPLSTEDQTTTENYLINKYNITV